MQTIPTAVNQAEQSDTGYFLFAAPCLIAVLVLVLNDHFLKNHFGAGPFGIVTGKLSDFAGAVILPAWIEFVLATVFRIRRKYALNLALVSSCLGLVAIELSPHAIQLYEAANNLVLRGFASVAAVAPAKAKLTADFTDLIALVMVPWVRKKCR